MEFAMKNNEFRTMWYWSGAAVLFMLLIGAWAWGQIPAGALIPVHWGVDGTADRYGSKFEGLLMMPLIIGGISILLAAVPYIDPNRVNIAQSAKAYKVTWGGTLVVITIVYIVAVANALGYPVEVGFYIPLIIGGLFVVMGNYMGKIRRNYMFGIRTPWTLASEQSWNKTHRLGGKLFMALGLGMMATVAWPWLTFYILIGGIVIMLVALFGYSYWVWKNDTEMKASE